MPPIKDITNYLEQIAPLAYQEDYDNAGLLVGDATAAVSGILICLEVTEAVLQEAQSKGCNLIIAHHPFIFRPIKKLTGSNAVERCMLQAIRQGIAIYAIHTNLDNVAHGVNQQIAQILGLQDLSILLPKAAVLHKLITFVPLSSVDVVLQALHQAGAGRIGNYTHCSFVHTGIGSFRPTEAATPYIGVPNQLEKIEESRIEMVFPAYLKDAIIQVLQATHPYGEVAYYIHKLENIDAQIGAGMLGTLPQPLSGEAFLDYLKAKMNLSCIRHTAPIDRPIKGVAVCGGAGSALIQQAIVKQADVLITADVKYHDFFNTEGKILVADIGHYESEVCIKALIYTLLSEKFANIAILECATVTNPIHYRW